jgi:hypothetical protein
VLEKNGKKITRHFGVDDALLAVYITDQSDPEYNEL